MLAGVSAACLGLPYGAREGNMWKGFCVEEGRWGWRGGHPATNSLDEDGVERTRRGFR